MLNIFFYCYLGDLKAGGFSIDACRSMIALMDVSSLRYLFWGIEVSQLNYDFTCKRKDKTSSFKALMLV